MREPQRALLAVGLAVALTAPMLPGAFAETITRTWTQTAQTDFMQGTGEIDVFTNPGSLIVGPDLPTDKTRWIRDMGSDTWSERDSPYISPSEGSLYGGRDTGGAWTVRYQDAISTPAPGKSKVTLYLYPSSSYTRYSCGNAFADVYLRFIDGARTADTLLWGIRANSWSSSYNVWGPYSEVTNINGWNWYKFEVDAPADFDLGNLRVGLFQDTYSGTRCYSTPRAYLNQYVAFGLAQAAEFRSNVHDTGGGARFGTLTYSGVVPAGSSLTVQTRTSGNGVDFTPFETALSGEPVPSPAGRFIQYRALFETGGTGSSRLDDVSVTYSIATDTTAPRSLAVVNGDVGCAGWLVSAPTVTIGAQDDLSGVQHTFYSLDGGFFQPYAGPFTVADGAHTLEYYSVDGASNVETPRSLTFRADTVAPATTLRLPTGSFTSDRTYVRPDLPVTLAAFDATSGVKATTFDAGNGAVAYSGPFALGSADGARSIAYGSEDRACNTESRAPVDVFVDGTAPDLTVQHPAPSSFSTLGVASRSAPELALAQEGLAQFGLYGSDVDVVADILRAGAEEMCGVAAAEACGWTAATGLAPRLGGAVVMGRLTVEADAFDPVVNAGASGLMDVRFFVDGALQHTVTEAPFTWEWDTTNTSMGKHDLTIVARDNVANTATTTMGVSVVPVGVLGHFATGGFVLEQANAPAFAQALYAFIEDKVRAQAPPAPPAPSEVPLDELPDVPDTSGVIPPVTLPDVPGVDEPEVPTLPPLPDGPDVPEVPGVPGVPAVPGLPEDPTENLPPLPPLPRVCFDDTCVEP